MSAIYFSHSAGAEQGPNFILLQHGPGRHGAMPFGRLKETRANAISRGKQGVHLVPQGIFPRTRNFEKRGPTLRRQLERFVKHTLDSCPSLRGHLITSGSAACSTTGAPCSSRV